MILRRNHTHQKTRPPALRHHQLLETRSLVSFLARLFFLLFFPHHSIAPAFTDGGGTLKQDFFALFIPADPRGFSELARSGSGIVPIERLRTTRQALRTQPHTSLPVLMSLRVRRFGHRTATKERRSGGRQQQQSVTRERPARRGGHGSWDGFTAWLCSPFGRLGGRDDSLTWDGWRHHSRSDEPSAPKPTMAAAADSPPAEERIVWTKPKKEPSTEGEARQLQTEMMMAKRLDCFIAELFPFACRPRDSTIRPGGLGSVGPWATRVGGFGEGLVGRSQSWFLLPSNTIIY